MADKKGIKKSAGDDVLINKRGMKSINKVPYLNLAIALALGKVTKNSFTEKLESFGFEPPAKLFEDVRNYIELKMPGYLDNNFRTYKDIDMDVLEDMKLSRLFGYIF